jgi:putative chitinase
MNLSNLKLKAEVMNELPSVIEKYKISTSLRLAHFLAQCSHESGDFNFLRENLNYSAKGLRATFPKYFPNDEIAQQYERQPEKIASKVYANRMGNAEEVTKDGFTFRGRGYIQLTGKDNYKAFGYTIGEDLMTNPDLVATKYPLTSAGFFFEKNNLWSICDKGDTDEVVTLVTKRVNGGIIGLADRISKFKKYKSLL